MLPTFCPPTIWTISLEFSRKPSILAAEDFLGACYRKAMTPQKAMDFIFSPSNGQGGNGQRGSGQRGNGPKSSERSLEMFRGSQRCFE